MGTSNVDSGSTSQPRPRPGPFLARVVSHFDPSYMGQLEVEILRPTGNSATSGQLHVVKYMSPFYGVTGVAHVDADPDDYNNTQKSYGMWMVPPDVGTTVMVIFVDGDTKRGYWIGCVPDENMNFMVPGIAAQEKVVEGGPRAPVAEYNKAVNQQVWDPEQVKKPIHPLADALIEQGLLEDDIRGITTSSSRREAPSMVFGISTPGPRDKRGGAKKGGVGKLDSYIENAYVSRLGGSTFVMDDGDDKFVRRASATAGPPDYAAVEQGETDGDPTIPHNELIRLRTRTGHQILMHNSEDLIYIGNARGTSWIELSSDGKIDIYAEDSVSIHSKQDFNLYADRDINMEAGRNINLKATDAAGLGDTTAAGRIQIEAVGDFIRIVNGNVFTQTDGDRDDTITGALTQSFESTLDITTGDAVNITTGGALNFKIGGASVVSSTGDFTIKAANTAIDGGNINFNSGIAQIAGTATAATPPDPLPTFANPTEVDGETNSTDGDIMLRIPSHEPWPHHENLDPESFKPDMTDREAGSDIPVAPYWKLYSTITDTFLKVGPAP